MTSTLSRAKLDARHRVVGELVLDTALHLGGGRNPAKGTDSPIVRDGFGRPFVPGSSLKGALRAAVERIAPNFKESPSKISACALYDPTAKCLTALPETDALRKNYRLVQEHFGQSIKGKIEKPLAELLQSTDKTLEDLPNNGEVTEDDLIFLLDFHLCHVCKAFGSPFLSSAIFFHDAAVDPKQWVGLTQVRDGVGIDRDSGRAVDGLKYDFEVVPPQTVFHFSMTIETSDPIALALAALSLHELTHQNVTLGGIRSRGLGRCHLEEDIVKSWVESLNLKDVEALKTYFETGKMMKQSIPTFVKNHISALWTAKEGDHV